MNAHCDAISTESGQGFSSLKTVQTTTGSRSKAVSSMSTGIFKSALARCMAYLHHRKMRKIDRDAFRHLAKLDDSILQDIGVSRADVNWAIKLPLSQNASEALQEVSRGYKKRA